MAVEIGSLVVKGTFGQAPRDDLQSRADAHADLARLRRELLRDVREMLDDFDRRARER